MGSVEKNKSGAVFFFDFARLLRLNQKTRHSLRRLKGRPESRAANHFKEEFFNLYKILRLQCTPQHQDEDAPGFASIGRQNRRWLRRTGLLRLREEIIKQRSTGKMLETWRWMENRQVCVWIDNCYIKQYGNHRCAHRHRHRHRHRLADRPAPIPSITALRDIVRDPVPNPGWKPLLLTTHQVSSYKGLVEVLDYIASLSNHTHPIVPILVDENIHKRCLKLLYCDTTQLQQARKTQENSHLVRLLASL